MNEARIGQIVILKTQKNEFEGVIGLVLADRISINYFKRDTLKIKTLKEGEVLNVFVHTKFGVKKMKSMVIDNSLQKLVIENAPTIDEPQNRQYVRTTVRMNIFVKSEGLLMQAKTFDLSAGGAKFELANSTNSLDNNSEVKVTLIGDALKDELQVNAKIIKILAQNVYVAQFINNNESVIGRISGFCMGNID